jgi:hypothetical protein
MKINLTHEQIAELQASLLDGGGTPHVEETAGQAVAALKSGESEAFFDLLCSMFRSILKALPHVNPPVEPKHPLHEIAVGLGFKEVPGRDGKILEREGETLTLGDERFTLVGKAGILAGVTAEELIQFTK